MYTKRLLQDGDDPNEVRTYYLGHCFPPAEQVSIKANVTNDVHEMKAFYKFIIIT